MQSRTLLGRVCPNPFFCASSTSPSHNLSDSRIRRLPLPQPISCSGNGPKRESGSPLAQTSYSHCRGNPTGIPETNTDPLSYHSQFPDSHPSQPGLGKILTGNVLTKADKREEAVQVCLVRSFNRPVSAQRS